MQHPIIPLASIRPYYQESALFHIQRATACAMSANASPMGYSAEEQDKVEQIGVAVRNLTEQFSVLASNFSSLEAMVEPPEDLQLKIDLLQNEDARLDQFTNDSYQYIKKLLIENERIQVQLEGMISHNSQSHDILL